MHLASSLYGYISPFNFSGVEFDYQSVVPVFDNLVANEGTDEIESELLDHKYILPKKSCFYMV